MKVISFSLWGNDPKYTRGAIRNVQLASALFPDWRCRFYVGKSTDYSFTENLQSLTKDWVRYARVDGTWEPMCGGSSTHAPKVEIYHVPEEGDWRGMFWRFEPAAENNVEAMISRDCDSRLSLRERVAVNEWMESSKGFHIMRDHPWHGTEILGGMWGVKRNMLPDMRELMADWHQEDRWQTDQDFLKAKIYPRVVNASMIHASFCGFEAHAQDFPMARLGTEFIGQVFDENETTIREHVEALAKVL
jgi:protein O-GlcNAc transferase